MGPFIPPPPNWPRAARANCIISDSIGSMGWGSVVTGSGRSAAVAIEQLHHLPWWQLGGVARFNLRLVLTPGIGPQGRHVLGRVARQCPGHELDLIRSGQRSTDAVLHAMGRLVRERVPDLPGGSMGTADHKFVAPGVIRSLQSSLAILLRHAHAIALEAPAQCINVSPGSCLDRNCC